MCIKICASRSVLTLLQAAPRGGPSSPAHLSARSTQASTSLSAFAFNKPPPLLPNRRHTQAQRCTRTCCPHACRQNTPRSKPHCLPHLYRLDVLHHVRHRQPARLLGPVLVRPHQVLDGRVHSQAAPEGLQAVPQQPLRLQHVRRLQYIQYLPNQPVAADEGVHLTPATGLL